MHLYFVALMVPPPQSEEINKIRSDIARKFGCRHALKTSPHITLQPPFRTQTNADELLKLLEPVSQSYSSFSVRTGSVCSFSDRVAFLEVIAPPVLSQLQQEVSHVLEEKNLILSAKHDFYPHITLAHRDVPRERINEIKRFAEERKSVWEFIIHEITLLIHLSGHWQISGSLPLK